MTQRRFRREEVADLMFNHLPSPGEGRRSLRDIADRIEAETGFRLSQDQLSRGAGYIREQCPDTPLVSRADGLGFTWERDEVNGYGAWRLHNAQSNVRRLRLGVYQPYLLRNRPLVVKRFLRDLTRVEEDLGELLEAGVEGG